MRKVTVNVPAELLEKAQEASGAGITQTGTDRPATGCGFAGVCAPASTSGKGPVFAKFGPVEV